MSFDVYEPARYPVVIWPDSVDGGRHLVSSWRVKDCCTITFLFNLAYCVCRQEPGWKEKDHRSAPADDDFDLGSEGWYRQKQMV
jgi:hypothetical protein